MSEPEGRVSSASAPAALESKSETMVAARPVAWRRGALVIAGAGALLSLAACALLPRYEALLVLADLAAGPHTSRLERITPAPTRSPVAYQIEERGRVGYLYLPGDGAARAAMVLVPGVVPDGIDDPRLVEFGTTLARVGFAVLTPDMPGYRALELRASDGRVVADAFAWLSAQAELSPRGYAGIGALSYAVTPAVLAALEPNLAERVRFILAIGGCYDLAACIEFFTTDSPRTERRAAPEAQRLRQAGVCAQQPVACKQPRSRDPGGDDRSRPSRPMGEIAPARARPAPRGPVHLRVAFQRRSGPHCQPARGLAGLTALGTRCIGSRQARSAPLEGAAAAGARTQRPARASHSKRRTRGAPCRQSKSGCS